MREATYAFDLFSSFGNLAALPCHLEWPRFRPTVLCPALSVPIDSASACFDFLQAERFTLTGHLKYAISLKKIKIRRP